MGKTKWFGKFRVEFDYNQIYIYTPQNWGENKTRAMVANNLPIKKIARSMVARRYCMAFVRKFRAAAAAGSLRQMWSNCHTYED